MSRQTLGAPLLDNAVICLVGADPIPIDRIAHQITNDAIVFANHGAVGIHARSGHGLEVQARMVRILLKELIGCACLALDIIRQRGKELAKVPGLAGGKHYSQPPSTVSPAAISFRTSRCISCKNAWDSGVASSVSHSRSRFSS